MDDRPSILLVDDDEAFRERMARAFRDRGYEARTAANSLFAGRLPPMAWAVNCGENSPSYCRVWLCAHLRAGASWENEACPHARRSRAADHGWHW